MEEKKVADLIPEQQTGAESNIEAEITLASEAEAQQLYDVARERLLNVNGWHQLTGAGTADFRLCDPSGNEVKRTAQPGDYFKIDIPGPGSATGDGFDWVQIEVIEAVDEAAKDSLLMRVRPASNPHNDRKDTAHFFSEEATSNFVVSRQGVHVKAEVHGRNEKPNTQAERIVDKARNAAVATGAISGFAKLQWKSLVNGLLKP